MTERDMSLGWLRAEIGYFLIATVIGAVGTALIFFSEVFLLVALIGAGTALLQVTMIGWKLIHPPKVKAPVA